MFLGRKEAVVEEDEKEGGNEEYKDANEEAGAEERQEGRGV